MRKFFTIILIAALVMTACSQENAKPEKEEENKINNEAPEKPPVEQPDETDKENKNESVNNDSGNNGSNDDSEKSSDNDSKNNDTNQNESDENSENNSNQGQESQPTSNSEVVDDPNNILVLVNKKHSLPAAYVPNDLVEPDVRFPFDEDLQKKLMRKPAATALEKMFTGAEKDGVNLFAQSGYRSYDRQEAIFASNAREHGREHANTFSAQAGESEHQTGLTMDVTSQAVGFQLIVEFANTEEGKWVKKHASEYGFIIRYPEGKTDITGYQYEPWHLRYVGKKAAQSIDNQNITLERYLGALN